MAKEIEATPRRQREDELMNEIERRFIQIRVAVLNYFEEEVIGAESAEEIEEARKQRM